MFHGVREFLEVQENRAKAIRLIFVVFVETKAEVDKELMLKDFPIGEEDHQEEKPVIEANDSASDSPNNDLESFP
jgi:elongation factor P--beta-lysine ligase